jgi:alkanesulfonate monooxygenase SsuD/methylene tetrahydromethanopterin reductase-like flavin-dependent oxidoreductase (luciferase family)
VRIDVKVLPEGHDITTLRRFWANAEDAGFDGIWTSDHLHAAGDPLLPNFEGWTSLAALAATTSRVRIGVGMTAVTFRNPALLAKMAMTVDHLSEGRLDMGIGAGWYELDHIGYGLAFPSPGIRVAMLDEACTILRLLWTGEVVSYEGRFWQLCGARCLPRPLQDRIPLTIGGTGPKMLGVVAMHADQWNCSSGSTLDDFVRLSSLLDERCDAVRRPRTAIKRVAQVVIRSDDAAELGAVVDLLGRYAEAGAEQFVFAFLRAPSRKILDQLRHECSRQLHKDGHREHNRLLVRELRSLGHRSAHRPGPILGGHRPDERAWPDSPQ